MSDHLIAEANRHAMTLPTTHPTHADIAWYVREVDQLRAEVESLHRIANAIEKAGKEQGARAARAEAEVKRLRAGVEECLRTNAHLADGEDCTLIGLKHCLHDPAAAPRQSALDPTARPSE
jgi:hypothetical protein